MTRDELAQQLLIAHVNNGPRNGITYGEMVRQATGLANKLMDHLRDNPYKEIPNVHPR